MTQIIKIMEKEIQTAVINMVYMSKKVEKSMSILRRHMERNSCQDTALSLPCSCVLSHFSHVQLWDPMYLHPQDFPGKNTGVGCHALLQGVFPTQGSNPGLPHCRQILYQLSHREAQRKVTAEQLMLSNCGAGEDSWEPLGWQGDQTSQS